VGNSLTEDARVLITSTEPVELQPLADCLRREDRLRGRVRLEPRFQQPGGQMGGVLEVLAVTLGSGGVGAVLAASLSTWLTHRRSDIKLTITGRDGDTAELDARRVRNIPELIDQVARLVDRRDHTE
jgi:membrane-associated two-gene conflict system component 1 (EACC1)